MRDGVCGNGAARMGSSKWRRICEERCLAKSVFHFDGRPFRTLNVIDEGNREALRIECGTSIPSSRVVRVLNQLVEVYGRPEAIRLDNGPELTADTFVDWAQEHGVKLLFIQPGKPNQNAFIERFNRSFRQEVLDAWLTDHRAQWVVGIQGGHQAAGDWPDFPDRQWVSTNGHYGYGCACLQVLDDARSHQIRRILRAWVRPLAACENDPALPARRPLTDPVQR